MTDITSSPEIITDKENLRRLMASSAQRQAVVFDLTSRINPQFHVETVRRVDNATDTSKHAGVVTTGAISELDEATRKADAIQRAIAGESPTDHSSIEEQIARETRSWKAEEDACEFLRRQIEAKETVVAIAYSKTKMPLHNSQMARLGKVMLEAHSILCEAYDLQRHLIDNRVGLRGLYLNLPSFLSAPNDKYSDFADWFRAMKREGHISAIPKEMR